MTKKDYQVAYVSIGLIGATYAISYAFGEQSMLTMFFLTAVVVALIMIGD